MAQTIRVPDGERRVSDRIAGLLRQSKLVNGHWQLVDTHPNAAQLDDIVEVLEANSDGLMTVDDAIDQLASEGKPE